MKFKPLLFFSLFSTFLLSGVSSSQERVLLYVEALNPSKGALRSGERFTQTYRVKYLDLSGREEEIILIDRDLQPDTVSRTLGAQFHVEDRSITNVPTKTNEIIRDYTYTIQVIGHEKGQLVLEGINFSWIRKKIGEPLDETLANHFSAPPVFIRYDSTIPEDPNLWVRDWVDLGDFSNRVYAFYLIFLSAMIIPLMFIAYKLRGFKTNPDPGVLAYQFDMEESKDNSGYSEKPGPWTRFARNFRIKKAMFELEDLVINWSRGHVSQKEIDESSRALVQTIRDNIKNALIEKTKGLTEAMSPAEIADWLETKEPGGRAHQLALFLKAADYDLDKNDFPWPQDHKSLCIEFDLARNNLHGLTVMGKLQDMLGSGLFFLANPGSWMTTLKGAPQKVKSLWFWLFAKFRGRK